MNRRNSFPLDFPATHREFGDVNPSSSPVDGQLGWDNQPAFQDVRNRRVGAQAEYRLFEERLARRPSGLTSVPLDPHSPTRVILINSNMGRGPSPRYINQGMNMHTPIETIDESMLTKEEQEIVLKKLKKEIYNPMPKILARRVSLYYRDLNKDPKAKAMDNKDKDEDGKSCAICLEDFEPSEQVMVTPCNHMFHENCIVPWVKNHGQCPVCRSAFCERIKENGSSSNVNGAAIHPSNHHHVFAGELLSLIRAVDEAFPWGWGA